MCTTAILYRVVLYVYAFAVHRDTRLSTRIYTHSHRHAAQSHTHIQHSYTNIHTQTSISRLSLSAPEQFPARLNQSEQNQ